VGGAPARAISEESAAFPTWSANGRTLLFYEDEVLYAAALPDLAPVAVTQPGQLGKRPHTWVP
jgi:hypothetical protein